MCVSVCVCVCVYIYSLPEEGRDGEEEKPGTDMVNSKLEELLGKTAIEVVICSDTSPKMKMKK